MVIILYYGIYSRNSPLDLQRHAVRYDHNFFTSAQRRRLVFLPIYQLPRSKNGRQVAHSPNVRRIRTDVLVLTVPSQPEERPAKGNSAGGKFSLGSIKESARHTILLDSVPPDLAILQFLNCDMRIDRSARFPTTIG